MSDLFSSFLLITGWVVIAWGLYFFAMSIFWFYGFALAIPILAAGWLCLLLSKKLDSKHQLKRKSLKK
jgi:hypothetical protein